MGDPASRRATYEDLLAVPAHFVAEIIHGQLVTQPRPAAKHARAASSLGGELYGPFDRGRGGPGGWIILDEPELHLQGHVLVPDLAGWRRERLPDIPDTAAIEVVPNWVCEVLSPSTIARDRADKMPLYANLEVQYLWMLDPLARTLEAYHLEAQRYSVLGTWSENAVVHAEPFEALALELSAFW
jgi:Uma2 family endonuclease